MRLNCEISSCRTNTTKVVKVGEKSGKPAIVTSCSRANIYPVDALHLVTHCKS